MLCLHICLQALPFSCDAQALFDCSARRKVTAGFTYVLTRADHMPGPLPASSYIVVMAQIILLCGWELVAAPGILENKASRSKQQSHQNIIQYMLAALGLKLWDSNSGHHVARQLLSMQSHPWVISVDMKVLHLGDSLYRPNRRMDYRIGFMRRHGREQWS